jgi:hypothetical protein
MAVRKRFNAGQIVVEDGWQHVDAVNHATTARIRAGQPIRVTPGHVRAAPSA